MPNPALEVGDIVQVDMRWKLAGQRVINTHYLQVDTQDGADPNGGYQAVADATETILWDNIRTKLSSDLTDLRIRVQKIRPTKQVFVDFVPTNISGSIVGDALPPQVAMVVNRLTELAGRHNQGRIFLAGIPEASCSLGQVNPVDLAVLQTMFNNWWLNTIVAGMWNFHSVHYARTLPPTFRAINEARLTANVATQRRRRLGRGE